MNKLVVYRVNYRKGKSNLPPRPAGLSPWKEGIPYKTKVAEVRLEGLKVIVKAESVALKAELEDEIQKLTHGKASVPEVEKEVAKVRAGSKSDMIAWSPY
jgi:hypothetical protein